MINRTKWYVHNTGGNVYCYRYDYSDKVYGLISAADDGHTDDTLDVRGRVIGGLYSAEDATVIYEREFDSMTAALYALAHYYVYHRNRDCRVCGGDGWTDGSAKLRRDMRTGDTTCIACDGTGKEGR